MADPRLVQQGIERREAIMVFLRECRKDGWTPTAREIGERIGCSHPVVLDHLKKLEIEGYLEIAGGRARAIRLTSKGLRRSR